MAIEDVFKNKGIDKLLYLDVDLLAAGDLSELFKEELNDSYVAAGVQDTLPLDAKNRFIKIKDSKNKFIFSNPFDYINAGVLLIDINKWCAEHIKKKAIQFFKENRPNFPDQDAINLILKDKIKLIDPKWNTMPPYLFIKQTTGGGYKYSGNEITNVILDSKYDVEHSLTDIRIYHFTVLKPWGNFASVHKAVIPNFNNKKLHCALNKWFNFAEQVIEFPELSYAKSDFSNNLLVNYSIKLNNKLNYLQNKYKKLKSLSIKAHILEVILIILVLIVSLS